MPTYTFRCELHGDSDVRRDHRFASSPQYCYECRHAIGLVIGENVAMTKEQLESTRMRRIYNPQRIIVRPLGYDLRPGERLRNGLGYDDFARELALGDLTEDSTGAYTPETRAKREAELAAADTYRPRPQAEIDRDIPERAHQELHEWSRAAYSRLEEMRDR